MTTITITIPDTPREREEVLSYLEAKGLVDRSKVPSQVPPSQGKSRWADLAEKMHQASPLDGESEDLESHFKAFRNRN